MGEQPANAVKAAEEKLHDEQLDWEDFCADKAELEEPVDESDRWVNIQRWVIEDLLDAARTEGRGDEPVAWRVSCANGEYFYRTEKPIAFNPAHVQPLYASPIREPEISREAVLDLVDSIGRTFYRSLSDMAWSESRAKFADAILNLAPVGVIAETPNNHLCAAPVGGRGEGWRPISEAPRDGSPILAASTNHEAREVVCWQDGEDSGSLDADAVCEGWVNAGEQKDRFYANPRWFTHWQPLPPPPQEQGGMK